jgi:hypothetical protein
MKVVNPSDNASLPVVTIGKFIFLLVLVYWSYQLIFTHDQWILLDYANLIIHETGHLLFIFTGQFFDILAGSLFQITVPIIALIYFFLTKQKMAIIFSIFWIGNNLINVSSYIKDARTMQIPLAFGATTHDWNWILSNLEILKYDQIIGNTFFGLGILAILAALLMNIINILKSFMRS